MVFVYFSVNTNRGPRRKYLVTCNKLVARFLKSRNKIVDYYLGLFCVSNNSALIDVTGRNKVENFSTVKGIGKVFPLQARCGPEGG